LKAKGERIAYFSMEYGMTRLLNLYSGGLGILSGDTIRAASNRYPEGTFAGVGLFYRKGFFKQRINDEGMQEEHTPNIRIENYAEYAKDENGNDIIIDLVIPGKGWYTKIYAPAWLLKCGRQDLYLLATDIPENAHLDQKTIERMNKLYFGDPDDRKLIRMLQEYVAGVGGMRLLQRLGIRPQVTHLNEGHCVFAHWEAIRQEMERTGLPFEEAKKAVKEKTVFTAHTPEQSGHQWFYKRVAYEYARAMAYDMDIDVEKLLEPGLVGDGEKFDCTEYALNNSRYANAVSRKHGEIASKMYHRPDMPDRPKIDHITNAVHRHFWQRTILQTKLEEALEHLKHSPESGIKDQPGEEPKTLDDLTEDEIREVVRSIDPKELLDIKQKMKEESIEWLYEIQVRRMLEVVLEDLKKEDASWAEKTLYKLERDDIIVLYNRIMEREDDADTERALNLKLEMLKDERQIEAHKTLDKYYDPLFIPS
jgi:alpha-glucan phosphorylase-like protein